MKTISFFLLSVMLFFSCKKYQAEKELSKEIVGTWELVSFIGFPANIPFPPGNGNTVSFLPGMVIEKKVDNALVFKGTYSLDTKTDCYPSDNNKILKTSEDPGYYQYIEVKDGKLLLSSPNCYVDGGTSFYRKLK